VVVWHPMHGRHPELFRQVVKMTDLLAAPRLLQQTFQWYRRGSNGNGSATAPHTATG
jgi:hypothetical protein